jgi:aminoglycoside 3-N-acetyltransferase
VPVALIGRLLGNLVKRAIGNSTPLLYVHSSFDWMRATATTPGEINQALLDFAGSEGTLAMPSFPRRRQIDAYMATCPVFDVRRTPTEAGLVPEVFRRMPGTLRSLHPWASVAARGPLAGWIVADHHLDVNPFAPGSPFARMLEKDVLVLGLGVSLNTLSFIHVLDDDLRDRLPFSLYAASPATGHVIDSLGESHVVRTLALRSEIIDNIKPSAALAELGTPPALIQRDRAGSAQVFTLRVRPFLEMCRQLAETALARGEVPPWHRQIPRA